MWNKDLILKCESKDKIMNKKLRLQEKELITDWEHLRKMWFYYMKHVSGGKIKINVDEL